MLAIGSITLSIACPGEVKKSCAFSIFSLTDQLVIFVLTHHTLLKYPYSLLSVYSVTA